MWPQKNSAPAGIYVLALVLIVGATAGAAALAAKGQGNAESALLFEQMATVFQSPRCVNCHTNAPFPTQGDDRHRHTMNVMRGPDDHGALGLHCSTCHQAFNQVASGVPGAPEWRLAPLRMGWMGLTPSQLCQSLFDPARGSMTPDQLIEHFNTGLVRWAWTPGIDSTGRARAKPPMSHEQFMQLTRKWIASGAICP